MEDHHSMNSRMRKSLSSDNTRATSQESAEESSWTMYLQDFLTSNNDDVDDDERSSLSSYGYENSSIISDAASAVTRKLSAINGEVLGFGNRSSFEFDKRKRKEALLDDALEDTASSPVNSPKVRILIPNSICFCWSNAFLISSQIFNLCLPKENFDLYPAFLKI